MTVNETAKYDWTPFAARSSQRRSASLSSLSAGTDATGAVGASHDGEPGNPSNNTIEARVDSAVLGAPPAAYCRAASSGKSAPQNWHFLAARFTVAAQTGHGLSSDSFLTATPCPLTDRQEVQLGPVS
jgi:hypothetical protein